MYTSSTFPARFLPRRQLLLARKAACFWLDADFFSLFFFLQTPIFPGLGDYFFWLYSDFSALVATFPGSAPTSSFQAASFSSIRLRLFLSRWMGNIFWLSARFFRYGSGFSWLGANLFCLGADFSWHRGDFFRCGSDYSCLVGDFSWLGDYHKTASFLISKSGRKQG